MLHFMGTQRYAFTCHPSDWLRLLCCMLLKTQQRSDHLDLPEGNNWKFCQPSINFWAFVIIILCWKLFSYVGSYVAIIYYVSVQLRRHTYGKYPGVVFYMRPFVWGYVMPVDNWSFSILRVCTNVPVWERQRQSWCFAKRFASVPKRAL